MRISPPLKLLVARHKEPASGPNLPAQSALCPKKSSYCPKIGQSRTKFKHKSNRARDSKPREHSAWRPSPPFALANALALSDTLHPLPVVKQLRLFIFGSNLQ